MTLRILIVDESPDAAEAISQQLRYAGHESLTASHAQGALALAEEYSPDVIVLDASLSQMDGIGNLRRLRMNPATATIPVILVVSHSVDDSWADGMLAGAADYVMRPIDVSDLLARINRLMRFHGSISHDHSRLLEGMAYTATTVLPCKLAWFLTVTPDKRWLVHQAIASDDPAGIAEQFYTLFHLSLIHI